MKTYYLSKYLWLPSLFLFAFYPLVLLAKEYRVTVGVDNPQAVINKASEGDYIIFSSGRYHVNLEINKPLTLTGEQGAVLDGNNHGDVIRVRAPDVTIKRLKIENSGHDLTEMNAGIFVEPAANNILIEKNEFDGNGFGIWLSKCKSPKVLHNRIHGETDRRSQDRGNGIHLSSVSQGVIKGNEVWGTRDGIYIENSNNNTLQDNVLHDLRYGIHYMYSHSNRVIGNHSYDTRTGYALMQSNRLTVVNNISERDRNYGILMNFITYSKVANNRIMDVQEGAGYVTGGAGVLGAEGKAIFI